MKPTTPEASQSGNIPVIISKDQYQEAEKLLRDEHQEKIGVKIGKKALEDLESAAPVEIPQAHGVELPRYSDFSGAMDSLLPDTNGRQEANEEPLTKENSEAETTYQQDKEAAEKEAVEALMSAADAKEPEVALPSIYEFISKHPEKDASELAKDAEDMQLSIKEKAAKEAMTELIKANLSSSARRYFKAQSIKSGLELQLDIASKTIKRANPNKAVQSDNNEETLKIRQGIREVEKTLSELEYESPESFFVAKGLELKKHLKEVRGHQLVTTPYVEKRLDRVCDNIKTGFPTFIHGPLGSGKTELAIMAAKKTAIENKALIQASIEYAEFKKDNQDTTPEENLQKFSWSYRRNIKHFENAAAKGEIDVSPIVISGSKDLSSQDLYTEKSLVVQYDQKTVLEHYAEIEQDQREWLKANPGANDQQRKAAAEAILQIHTQKSQAFGTAVEEIKRGLYLGVEKGVPVVIDEVNAIPAAILISMNDILQRRPGEKCNVPGVGQVEIQPGFAIIMTGNISTNNVTYGGTETLNPAFLSRLDSFEYGYLPMSEHDKFTDQKDPAKNELFQAMLCYLIDDSGNLQLPKMEESLDKLFSLAQLAHDTQTIFSGKWRESSVVTDNSGEELNAELDSSVLSIRNLINVLNKWNRGENGVSIDEALWNGFISNLSTNADDQNLIIALAHRRGFFSERDGWKVDIKPVGSTSTTEEEIHPGPWNREDLPLDTYDLSHTLEVLYGERPERRIYPDDINIDIKELDSLPTNDEITDEDYESYEDSLAHIGKVIQALEILSAQCGCSKTA